MKTFWDERYSVEEYVYGKEPNIFFKSHLVNLRPGKILLPGEGEGRNAVFAAELGWNVTAIDQSEEGQRKGLLLADAKNVTINYMVQDFHNFECEHHSFDCIALIFVHIPKELRNIFHNKILNYLKPGGNIILEGFLKQQINNHSGGPKNSDMLFSKEELAKDFESLNKVDISEHELMLNEGAFHLGKANVIRLIGNK